LPGPIRKTDKQKQINKEYENGKEKLRDQPDAGGFNRLCGVGFGRIVRPQAGAGVRPR